jgi:O-antigen ligase
VVLALQFAKVKRHLWSFLIATVLVAAIANALFAVNSAVLEASGRDASLTGRTGIWETVLSEPINPVLGTGYTAFWLGERLQRIWALYPRTPLIQAHNGYLEVYLNLGVVGLALLGGVLWTGLRNARRRLLSVQYTIGNLDDSLFQTFGIAYIVAYLVYNITEATFVGLSFLFIIFLLLAFELQRTCVHGNGFYIEQRNGSRAVTSEETIK